MGLFLSQISQLSLRNPATYLTSILTTFYYVMVKSKGFEVALRSNGHDLNEHPVPQTNPHKIVRYVDAAPGTQFAVRYRLPSDRDPRENKTFSGWLISVYADGEYVTSQLRQGSQRDGSIDGNPVYNNGLLAVQKMQFARTAVGEQFYNKQIQSSDFPRLWPPDLAGRSRRREGLGLTSGRGQSYIQEI